MDSSPEPDCPAPSKRAFSHTSKRRRLAKQSAGFVPASSLRTFALGSWLEAPRSTASSSSSSSSSFSSSSYLTPVSVLQPRPNETNTLASPSPPPAAASSSNSLSFLTEEERRWLNGDEGGTSAGTRLSRFLPESELYRNVSEAMALLSTRLHLKKAEFSLIEDGSCSAAAQLTLSYSQFNIQTSQEANRKLTF